MHFIQRGPHQGNFRAFHGLKVAGVSPQIRQELMDLSSHLFLPDEIALVKRDVILVDRATTSIERIFRQLQGASLIGAERAKDEITFRMRNLGSNAIPGDARKAKFEAIADDIWSVLAHNHRIYYLVEADRVVILDVILDAEIHSVTAD